MEDFTPAQRNAIIKGYYNMAQALNEYQVSHWPELSHEQHLDLNAYQNSLLNRAQDLETLSSRPAFVNVLAMSTNVQRATADAQASLKYINNLTIALNIGALTVALAAYVARANLRGIQTALRELNDLLTLEKKME
ncbi:hypothetical protein GO730_06590 [Spirosoma sp. HMF3257]|uniref:Uncharacterized protein n=1 Tax=Spirosoma telluris TaxID=2183553 RepID=A0A327NFI4_9BACT|nr:hypothetical protein [Spirosoma telluris]RAI74090.1 hypothetical protein HMF3257_06530 [Spirosoma telluris]